MIKIFVWTHKLYIVGAVIGALAGYLYWKYIGCLSGTCAITSSTVNSTVYFAVLGMLFFGLFKKSAKEGKAEKVQ